MPEHNRSADQRGGKQTKPEHQARGLGSAEVRLALGAVRSFVTGTPAPTIPQGIDWDYLRRILLLNNLVPIFRSVLDLSDVAPQLAKRWNHATIRILLDNTRTANAAVKLFAILDDAGIAGANLRGLSLAHGVYPDPALRPMRDVDVLIHAADRDRLPEVMAAHNLEPVRNLRSQFIYRIDGTIFEIHWSLLAAKRYRFAADFERWIGKRQSMEVPGGEIQRLCIDDELLGLVAHAFVNHELDRLVGLVDIAMVMTHCTLDWAYIAEWCSKARMTNLFLFTLSFVNDLFGLGMEDRLGAFGRKLPRSAKRTFEAYAVILFGEDTPADYFRRKRNLMYVAEKLPTKLRQLLRFAAVDEARYMARVVWRRRVVREGRHEDRRTLKGYETPGA